MSTEANQKTTEKNKRSHLQLVADHGKTLIERAHTVTTIKATKRERVGAVAGLLAMLILTILCGSLLTRLKASYSVSQFLPANHPLLKMDHEARAKFFLDDAQPILITLNVEKGDWLETGRLTRLSKITKELSTLDGASGALSLGTVPTASQKNDELTFGTLLEISYADRLGRLKNDRLLNPLLVSENGRQALVMIGLRNNEITTEAMNHIMTVGRIQLQEAFPDATISVGGIPALQTQLAALVKTELMHFMGLALLASCLTLLLVFSSKWTLIMPFIGILVTNVFVLAFMAMVNIPMTVLASTVPVLVSVTVLSLCIHSVLRFVEDIHGHKGPQLSKSAHVFKTLKSLAAPNLLTALTSCFGFATLIMQDVPVIRDFGIAVAVSVMISWICSNLLLAPLLILLPIPVVRGWMSRDARWAAAIFKRNRAIVGTVLVGCLVFAVIGQHLHWSARLFDDLPNKEEARIATEEIDHGLGGTIPFEILVDQEKKGDQPWNDPKAVKSLDSLLDSVRKLPEVGSALGLPDLLRMALGNPSAAIPEARRAIAETWFMISMSDNNPLKQFLTADGKTTRLGLRLRDVAGDHLETAMNSIQAQVQLAFPDAHVSTGGMATTVHRLNNGLSHSLMDGFWEALGVITILLFCVFRSWRWTLLAVLPNLVPAAVLVGVLALAQTPIKPGVALVFSIALGIAFNNTVYLLQRLRSLMNESGRSAGEEIERALRVEGNPCLIASLCLLSGFGIFLFSEFGINRTFGAYMLISLFFGLVGDLAFMPALLRWFPGILVSTVKVGGANLTTPIQIAYPEEPMRDTNAAATATASSKAPRAAAAIAALMTGLLAGYALPAHAADDANSILKNVESRLNSQDERANIKMKVVESNGSSKERDVEIMRKSGDKQEVLVRLKAPSDVSGVALLSVSKGGSEDQWIYMPSQKKARRVVSGNKSQRFLDTEFAVEDFSANTYAHFSNKLVKQDRSPSASIAVIESTSKGADSSSYSKIMTWIDTNTYQVQKSEYYDQTGKLLKTMVFRDYQKYGQTWRAKTIEVRNMQTQRSTILSMGGLKLNSGIPDREFTQSALEQED